MLATVHQTLGTPHLSAWAEQLTAFANSLGTVEEVLGHRARFDQDWIAAPPSLAEKLETLAAAVKARPDQSASMAAHSFLTLAQDRLETFRQTRRAEKRAQEAVQVGKIVYDTYCDVAEERLSALYEAVEGDFSDFYREINGDDEGAFKAKFEPAEGKLGLEVAFYDKGMFPPGAYHSESHQDGMEVCLYLALMKRLLGGRFHFAVLDDVVMSVDQDHRKQFCRLLKNRFPETQFIITTHDKVWAKQMQTEGLVEQTSGVASHRWSIRTGPIFDQIDSDLAKNDVETAASRLRRHLEYIAAELADQLGAKPAYRGDFSYDLGDLLPAVIGRQGELLKLAAKAWTDDDAETKVEAFKTLLLQFRCSKPGCESWLYVTPRKGGAEALRCRCMGINLNLRPK